jgi:hypothetical protein
MNSVRSWPPMAICRCMALPGAGLNVTTGRGVVAGVIGGYEQGGYTPAVSCSAQFTSNVPALYATAVAGG